MVHSTFFTKKKFYFTIFYFSYYFDILQQIKNIGEHFCLKLVAGLRVASEWSRKTKI